MKYYDVINDILKYYSNFLSNNEIVIINKILLIIKDKNINDINDEIIIFINRILDRIWNLELTDIDNYKDGDNFTFLVKDIHNCFYSENSNIIVNGNINTYQLINENIIIDKDIDDCGEIVSINYTNNLRTTPLLPIYFYKKVLVINNLNYNIDGYYAINTKIGDIDENIAIVKSLELKNNKKAILLDKMLYRNYKNKEILSEEDINSLMIIYILNYFKNKYDIILFVKYRDLIYKKIKTKCKILLYKLYEKEISLDFFQTKIYKLINDTYDSLTITKKL